MEPQQPLHAPQNGSESQMWTWDTVADVEGYMAMYDTATVLPENKFIMAWYDGIR